MRSLDNIEEVQYLIVRLTTISQFLPHLVDKTRLMTILLKKSIIFTWGKECQEKFDQLKQMLASPLSYARWIPSYPYSYTQPQGNTQSLQPSSKRKMETKTNILCHSNSVRPRNLVLDRWWGSPILGNHDQKFKTLFSKSPVHRQYQLPYPKNTLKAWLGEKVVILVSRVIHV